ncbi:MAG: YggS family pyridoxal phosphate-dependent enzyme [Pyrinomonadaceae bacterium MAG19_C2-C3]|nr:YggS family pyridoxal phosphate-dependent enzyme [Pyrinomonadaceae bacterium MAG19_C2-C3]
MMSQSLSTIENKSIAVRYAVLRERIAAARRRIERDNREAGEVRLIAVSKTHSVERVREAIAAGAFDFGENRVQEAAAKFEIIGRDTSHDDVSNNVRWHLIGHLQANKARRAVNVFDVIHSIDSVELVKRLERLCIEDGRAELPVLVQVDLGGEATKTGIGVADLPPLIEACAQCERIKLVGLMTLPPYLENVEDVRLYFRRLRELRDEWRARGAFAPLSDYANGELSMGMSHDFEVAIEEGATMVRVGTQLFGAREQV